MDENVNSGQYQIRLHKDNWELEISAPEKDFVLNEWERLAKFSFSTPGALLNNISEKVSTDGLAGVVENGEGVRYAKPQTLVEFIRRFNCQSNLEKTLVLGYWCEIKLGQPGFTRDDILAKYREAKEQPPKNIGRDLGLLVSRGLLLESGQPAEMYELTNTGIHEVEQKLSGQS